MEIIPDVYAYDEVSSAVAAQESVLASLPPIRPNTEARTAAKSEKKEKKESIDENQAQEIAEKMDKLASLFNTKLSFSVDESTGRNVIRVLDRETGTVIRQIPPEEILKLIGRLKDVMGMLLDVET